MSEKTNNNMFRFSLYQEKLLLCEKVFDADQFNPFTRYSIDIRNILPRAITTLQKTLSKRAYETSVEVGHSSTSKKSGVSYVGYDLYDYHQKMINKYPKEYRYEMEYHPEPIIQQIEEKTIRGVECKIGFYINDKPIVERTFYVDGFNPIKKCDIKNMWDDYDLINIKGLSINQIRELSPAKREEMLRKLRKN
jgi:hypothetical protein